MSICKLCLENVTNPLCISCISSSAEEWIKSEGDELFLEYSKKSSRLLEFLSESEENVEFCIKCREETLKVLCPGCYTQMVYKVLESINWIKAEKFKIIFDFGTGRRSIGLKDGVVDMNVFNGDDSNENGPMLGICGDCGSARYFMEKMGGDSLCDRCS